MSRPVAQELQRAARHLLQQPLTCAELNPEEFTLIRRHEHELDRLFTQRLGYRMQLTADTARLYKSTVLPHRPVLAAPINSKRALSQRECVLLSLVLAAVASGPRIISLRDLIDLVRTASVDAEVSISDEPMDRRAMIMALKWMIAAGLLTELHEQIDRYEQDSSADAILEVFPERVALLPLPKLSRAESVSDLFSDSGQSAPLRQTLRAYLAENPVMYREDVSDYEWSEMRRRLGEDVATLDELFGLRVEVRAEGIAAIDPMGKLSDQLFPTTGTVGHAALLLIEEVLKMPDAFCSIDVVDACLEKLAKTYQRIWAKSFLEDVRSLRLQVIDLLDNMRLCESSGNAIRLLPAAARFRVTAETDSMSDAADTTSARRSSALSTQSRKSTQKKTAKKKSKSSGDNDSNGNGQQSLW